MKEREDSNENIIQIEEPKEKKTAPVKKVKIDDDTIKMLYGYRLEASAARRAIDSGEYTDFYAALVNVIEIADYINESRKAKKVFDENKAYQSYVNAVNVLKDRAKDYEDYKLRTKTENPEGEPGKKKVNSDDIGKLKVVRAVNRRKMFKVPRPTKPVDKYKVIFNRTDEALKRLQEGNYLTDEELEKDAIDALLGQMVRASGGSVLIDPNTGKSISYKAFKERNLQLDLVNVLKDKEGNFKDPKWLYKNRMTNYAFLNQMVDAAVRPDDPNMAPLEEQPRTGQDAMDYMLSTFADDMEDEMLKIMSTYGSGKSDSSPSKLMKTVLNGMRGFSSKDGKKLPNTAEDRKAAMKKLGPEEFGRRIDVLTKTIDNYLGQRQNPSKADRVDRNQHLYSLKRKLANYKKELTAIQGGKKGFTHKPKIGNVTKGDSITYSDLKKNLLAFVFDMAEKSEDGADLIYRYDPESYDAAKFGANIRPDRPSADLKKVFDTFKDFRSLFKLKENGEPPFVSFDVIKEKVTAFNRAVTLYKSKNANKKNEEMFETIDMLQDSLQEVFKNMEFLQPYMDIQTAEGRIGGKNIYDVKNTMENTQAKPYKNLIIIASETTLSQKATNVDEDIVDEINRLRAPWAGAKNALASEKGLIQKKITKGIKLRDELVFYNVGYGLDDDLCKKPASANISQQDKQKRNERLLKKAASNLVIKFTDEVNMWSELAAAGSNNDIIKAIDKLTEQVLKDSPAFINVVDKSTFDNIEKNVLKEAERLGVLQNLKRELGPDSVRRVARDIKAEKKKQIDTAMKK